MAVPATDLRKWLEARRAAERREEVEREVVPSNEAIERGLRLIAFAASFRGWPPPEDPENWSDDRRSYDRWNRLRAALRRK